MDDENKTYRAIRCFRSRQKIHPDDRAMVFKYVQSNACVDALSFMLEKCEYRSSLMKSEGASARQTEYEPVKIGVLDSWHREFRGLLNTTKKKLPPNGNKEDGNLFD